MSRPDIVPGRPDGAAERAGTRSLPLPVVLGLWATVLAGAGSSRRKSSDTGPSRRGDSRLHIHWFRWVGTDPFSNSSLYGCRCGVIRPSM
jgi:hypothetical protein